MPIYEYRCRNGHDFEVFQSMSDAPVVTCVVCGEPVERVFSPVAVHYKGSGFYTTDYARRDAKSDADGPGKKGDGDAKKADSSSDTKSDAGSSKAESATTTKSKSSGSE